MPHPLSRRVPPAANRLHLLFPGEAADVNG
jgi:hypothetical protein